MSLDKGKQKGLTFTTEAERQRVREALFTESAKELARIIGGPEEGWGIWRDWLKSFASRLYPPVVEAPEELPRTAQAWAKQYAERTPAPDFAAAVDALEAEAIMRDKFPYGSKMEYDAARAEVLRLYEEARRDSDADIDAPSRRKPSMPSDAAFREALDALVAFVRVDERERTRHSGERNGVLIARARVLALYAERQGEVGQITDTHNWLEGGRGGTLTPMYSLDIEFQGDMTFNPGNRVWVTKVEEGQ